MKTAKMKAGAYLLPIDQVNRANRLIEQIAAITNLVAVASEVQTASEIGTVAPAKDDSIPCALWAVDGMVAELRNITNARVGEYLDEAAR